MWLLLISMFLELTFYFFSQRWYREQVFRTQWLLRRSSFSSSAPSMTWLRKDLLVFDPFDLGGHLQKKKTLWGVFVVFVVFLVCSGTVVFLWWYFWVCAVRLCFCGCVVLVWPDVGWIGAVHFGAAIKRRKWNLMTHLTILHITILSWYILAASADITNWKMSFAKENPN